MSALIQALSENLIGRPDHSWDENLSWIENSIREHRHIPFHAILARKSEAGCAEVLSDTDIGSRHPLWDLPVDKTVSRTPQDLANAVAPLLRMATRIIFVDYMLGFENARYRQSMAEFLRRAAVDRPNGPLALIEIVTTAGGEPDFFAATCRAELPRLIPAGMKIRIWKVAQIPEGIALHNRYILTDRGGINFGWGLDRGRDQDEDDLVIIGKDRFDTRWQQYSNLAGHFDVVVGPIDINSSN
jgi:hypothetical protein